jgi:hypothetical protein
MRACGKEITATTWVPHVQTAEGTMTTHEEDVDPVRIQIILDCLEQISDDISVGEHLTLFVVHQDGHSWQLRFNRDFLENVQPVEDLQPYIDTTVIPSLLANPDRRLEVGPHGEISVFSKSPTA